MSNQLTPQDPFWAELLKGFGLPYKFIVGLSLYVDASSAKIMVRHLPLDEAGKPIMLDADEDYVEVRYAISYRNATRYRGKNVNRDLVDIFRPRLGLPAHVVSFRMEVYKDLLPFITCEFEPEPFTDSILGDGNHIREALAPFELTKEERRNGVE